MGQSFKQPYACSVLEIPLLGFQPKKNNHQVPKDACAKRPSPVQVITAKRENEKGGIREITQPIFQEILLQRKKGK